MYFFEPLILSFEVEVRKGVISGGDRPQRLKGGGGAPHPLTPLTGMIFLTIHTPYFGKKEDSFFAH